MRGSLAVIAVMTGLLGCGHRTEQYVLPQQVTDFAALYGANCAGCHGRDGHEGPAPAINNARFLSLIGKEGLRDFIAGGIPGTPMPAFSEAKGGSLTDRQIELLAAGMETKWSRPRELSGISLPAYRAALGDSVRGKGVYESACAKCHTAGAPGGSIVDPSFLALVSDQSLRNTVIIGCRGASHRSLIAEEIADVVAWISAHRLNSPREGKSL
jgi:cytochrome c oxidase cbb3-type subunit 3